MTDIPGTSGRDILKGTNRSDNISGFAGNDDLFGRGGRDALFGGIGNDKLDGGDGSDVLNGGGGTDKYFGGSGADYFTLSDPGLNTVDGGSGKDTVYFNFFASGVQLQLSRDGDGHGGGGAAGDTFEHVESIWRSDFNDILRPAKGGTVYGNPGDDLIFDAKGKDSREILDGGDGLDILKGHKGGGGDFFAVHRAEGVDSIYGFTPADHDKLYIDNFEFNFPGEVVRVANAADNHASVAGPQFIYETDSHKLWFDPDGARPIAPVEVALLPDFGGTLSARDFVFFHGF